MRVCESFQLRIAVRSSRLDRRPMWTPSSLRHRLLRRRQREPAVVSICTARRAAGARLAECVLGSHESLVVATNICLQERCRRRGKSHCRRAVFGVEVIMIGVSSCFGRRLVVMLSHSSQTLIVVLKHSYCCRR
jgi:hypothetical protein